MLCQLRATGTIFREAEELHRSEISDHTLVNSRMPEARGSCLRQWRYINNQHAATATIRSESI